MGSNPFDDHYEGEKAPQRRPPGKLGEPRKKICEPWKELGGSSLEEAERASEESVGNLGGPQKEL